MENENNFEHTFGYFLEKCLENQQSFVDGFSKFVSDELAKHLSNERDNTDTKDLANK